MTAPSSRRRWAKLAAAIAIAALGVDLFQPRSAWLRIGPPLLFLGGVIWAAALLFLDGVPAGALRRLRFLRAATLVVSVCVALLVTTLIRLGPSRGLQRLNAGLSGRVQAQGSDPELGWGPSGEGRVGQRLDRVDPARDHLLLIGDSIVFGHGVGDGEHVGRRMADRMPSFQVLNGGVSGYSIDQYYLYLDRLAGTVKPKRVVVGLFTGNDYQVTGREFSWGTSKPLFVVRDGALVRANEGDRCIDDLSRSVLFGALWRSRDFARGAIDALCAPRELTRGELEPAIARLFVEIEAIAVRHGARPLFVLLPVQSDYNVFDEERFLYTGRYRDLRRLLVRGKHDYFEPLPALARAARQGPEPIYLEDHAHFTPRGHDVLAGAIVEALKERGVRP